MGQYTDSELLNDERRVKRQGEQAARDGHPITACPHKELRFASRWRDGWTEAREKIRRESDDEYRRALEVVPEGGHTSSTVGQRMGKARARALLGEGFA